MKKIAVLALGVFVLAATALAWFMTSSSGGISGAAKPDEAAVTLDVEWFIGEGELVLGTNQLRIPLGMNVKLLIDSDAAYTLTIEDYGVHAELLADQVTAVHFHAHTLGSYRILLQGQERPLGELDVFEKGSI